VNTINFDVRWLSVIFLILMLFYRSALTDIALGMVGAAWMLQAGLEPWRRGRSTLGSTKVTYWRGQRIVTKQPARARFQAVSNIQTVSSIVYLVLGVASAYAALYWFADVSGLF
jgi:small-conductance mechanosensitive channel